MKEFSTERLQGELQDLIEAGQETMIENGDISMDDSFEVTTFQNAGLMTNDAGLVIITPDGSEFQVTIIRSR